VHGIMLYWNSSQFFEVAYHVNDHIPTFAFDSLICHIFATSSWGATLWIESTNRLKQPMLLLGCFELLAIVNLLQIVPLE